MHDHSHEHHILPEANLSKAFLIGIVLNTAFVVIEVIAGLIFNSLALIGDAGHNLGDVAGLALSLVAFRLAKKKPNELFTYGYRKSTILVSLLNAVILLVGIGAIGIEAVRRLQNPQPVDGKIVALVAAIGIVVNGVTALYFLRDRKKDLNVQGTYLHMASDAAISLGVLIAGIIMHYTNWWWLDSVVSLVIIGFVLFGTWSLLAESARLSLDAVPKGLNVEEVRHSILNIRGVMDFHHIHIWALSTSENAITAHLVLLPEISHTQEQDIKNEVRHALSHFNIPHITLETEYSNVPCEVNPC